MEKRGTVTGGGFAGAVFYKKSECVYKEVLLIVK
jgi:hypothetical protein